jgi:hypothetical protein
MKVTAMRFFSPAVFLVTCCAASCAFAAQAPASAPAAATQGLKSPSAIMQPAIDALQQTLNMLRPEKWKMPGAEREEATANISSITHDLQGTLPSLLASADGAPNSVVQVLPAFRNIEALYDVLLRVAEAGNLSAPDQQRAALEEARVKLEEGRRALGDRLQSAAIAREKEVRDLQAAVRAVPPPAPAPAPCPPPPVVKKHKPRKKVVKKAVPAAATPQGAVPATTPAAPATH